MSNNITVIIPVHEMNETVSHYFPKSIESLREQNTLPEQILVVRSKDKDLTEYLDNYDFGNLSEITKVVENDSDDTTFQGQLNYGVSQTTTTYFTFLEYDDEFSKIWVKNSEEYIKHYPEVGVFLPIIFECDAEGKFLSFTNQNVWVNNVAEQPGFLDINTLQKIQNFNFDGMVVKKELYEEHGGLKTNMKLTFTYEFLLRMSYKSVPIMVIPKLGYKHVNSREGSLFDHYKNTVNVLESKFWVNKAKKEYFHTEDREITYDVETV